MFVITIKVYLKNKKKLDFSLKPMTWDEIEEQQYEYPDVVRDIVKMQIAEKFGVPAMRFIDKVFVVYNNMENIKNAN